MCEDSREFMSVPGDPDRREDPDTSLSRRSFGGMLLAAAGSLGVTSMLGAAEAAHAAPATSADGLVPVANAMHIHTSFSEGPGSLGAQLSEAARNNIDVLWKTDHDWREIAHGAPQRISFTSLNKEDVSGRPLLWQPQVSGTLSEHAGGIVTSPVSPNDPSSTPGSLWIRATAAASSAAFRFYANFGSARVSQRTNLAGQSLQLDLYPTDADGTDSVLEVLITLSNHPPSGGRPAGRYQLSYRFGQRPAGYEAQQLLGIVHCPAVPNTWQQITVDPIADIRAIWPDLIAEDNALFELWLGAISQNGQTAEGYFDNLRFVRTRIAPDQVLATERSIKAAYAAQYPKLLMPRGREISYYERHLNAFGSDLIPDYSSTPKVWANDPGWTFSAAITMQLKQTGALVSLNHPFGTTISPPTDAASQNAALQRVFADLYTHAVCGVDILEVGYQQRGGVKVDKTVVSADISTHQRLWDMLSRNGFYLTGNGATDNHTGGVGSWRKEADRFVTYVWAKAITETDLLAGLTAGRAYVGELGSFAGSVDLLVDSVVPMGAVSVRPDLTSRTLRVIAAGLPANTAVRIVQGPVDHPGAATVDPGTVAVQTLPVSAFAGGGASVTLDTSRSCFVRVDVLSSAGRTIGFSNPIYLLHEPSVRPVPTARRAVDSRG